MAEENLILTYFDIKGKAESSRIAFHAGGIQFTDLRLTRDQFFGEYKNDLEKCPTGQLPTLTIGGKVISQSASILRYAGKLSGLYPAEALEALYVDEIIDLNDDIAVSISPSIRESDEEKKMEMRKVLAEKTLPIFLAALERKLDHNGNTGFFVGDKLTICDIDVYIRLTWLNSGMLDGIPKGIVDSYPLLSSFLNTIVQHEVIVNYYKR